MGVERGKLLFVSAARMCGGVAESAMMQDSGLLCHWDGAVRCGAAVGAWRWCSTCDCFLLLAAENVGISNGGAENS